LWQKVLFFRCLSFLGYICSLHNDRYLRYLGNSEIYINNVSEIIGNYLVQPLIVKFLSPFDAEASHVYNLDIKMTPKILNFYLCTTDFICRHQYFTPLGQ